MTSNLELLAPAGKWPVLEEVVRSGADAVYLGGKRFNMRLLRPDFNFADQEIRDAADFCHERGVKLYITVNNLYYENEINELGEYLAFLASVGVDALIVQDLGTVQLAHELKLSVPLHASVQMGVNNLETVSLLERNGFTRAILSKNLSLEEITYVHNNSKLGLEYFVHGDMCIAHTGQCFLSSIMFGESGNRGQCRKPCRWRYQVERAGGKNFDGEKYFLAHKDLCLYPHLKELIKAGITSFKIEGRMRESEYVGFIVSAYRRALDKILSGEQFSPNRSTDWVDLNERRVRDYSVGSIHGKVGAESIGFSGEREPKFPTNPIKIEPLNEQNYREIEPLKKQLTLSIKVGGVQSLDVALEKGVNTIILPTTVFRCRQGGFKSRGEISNAVSKVRKAGAAAIMEFPRIVTLKDETQVQQLLEMAEDTGVSAIMAHDPGTLTRAVNLGLRVWAGTGLNLANSRALQQVKAWGAIKATPSVELNRDNLVEMAAASPLPLELVVHGPLCAMISDYCVAGAVADESDNERCSMPCRRGEYILIDELGQRYIMENDLDCRTYMYYPHDLALLHILPELLAGGIESIRIRGDRYTPQLLGETIDLYKSALKNLSCGEWQVRNDYTRMLGMFANGLTSAGM
ncbi:MAG: peptidase U32 family protein [Candidatus Saccharibacteria bacterium]